MERDVAVVLSGGAVNGLLMELGFLKRLRETDLWPRIGWIYGTSSGAVTGVMAALDRLDDLEEFMFRLQPEDTFRPHSLWRLPLLGSHDYRLPETVNERLGDLTEGAPELPESPIEVVVYATDVSQDVHRSGAHPFALSYSSRSTDPATIARAGVATPAGTGRPRQGRSRWGTRGAPGGRRLDRATGRRAPRRGNWPRSGRALRICEVPLPRRPADSTHRRAGHRRRDLARDRAPAPASLGRRPETRSDRTRLRDARRGPRRPQRCLGRFERDDLAGIHDPVRVEQILDATHDRQQVAVLEREVLELSVADPVLARARAAARERIFDDRAVEPVGLRDRRGVFRIEQERDVEVPVADMADDAAAQVRRVERFACVLDRRRELRDRHRDVRRHRPRSRSEREGGHQRVVTRAPHLRARRRVALRLECGRAFVFGQLLRRLQFARDD